MSVKLSDCRVSRWILTIDLLGTAQRMAEDKWLDSLGELLTAILTSVSEATSADSFPRIFQYGDTISMCHDDLDVLVEIAVATQNKFLEEGILAQMGISGENTYLINRSKLHDLVDGDGRIKMQLLVGPGMARSHLILRGVKGPRIVIDADRSFPPKGDGWEKVVGLPTENRGKIPVSEVRWWKDRPEVGPSIQQMIQNAQTELDQLQKAVDREQREAERQQQGFSPDRRDLREIESLKERIKHLNVFLDHWKTDRDFHEGTRVN